MISTIQNYFNNCRPGRFCGCSSVSSTRSFIPNVDFEAGKNIENEVKESLKLCRVMCENDGKKAQSGMSGSFFIKGYSKRSETVEELKGFQQMKLLNKNTPEVKMCVVGKFLELPTNHPVIVMPKIIGRTLSSVNLKDYDEDQRSGLIKELAQVCQKDQKVRLNTRLCITTS